MNDCIQVCPLVDRLGTIDTVILTHPVGWGTRVNAAKQKDSRRRLRRPMTSMSIGTCRLGHGHVPKPDLRKSHPTVLPTRLHSFVHRQQTASYLFSNIELPRARN